MKDLQWAIAQRRQPINPAPNVGRTLMSAADDHPPRTIVSAPHWGAPPLLVMICLALISASVGWSYGRLADPPPTARIVLVQPGDTLWGICSQYSGRHDVRDLIVRVAAINGWREESPLLRVGQTLVVEDWRGRPLADALGR